MNSSIDLYVGSVYTIVYLMGFFYVTVRNECQFNLTNICLFMTFFVIYALLLTSVIF
jgi:hypothetical protein